MRRRVMASVVGLVPPLWWTATLFYAVAAGALVVLFVLNDRRQTLALTEAQTQSLARLLIEHAERALEDAEKLITSLQPQLSNWDLQEAETGRRLFEEARRLQVGSPQIASVWVIDAAGDTILDTWSFPSRPAPAGHRGYYKQHVSGAPDPVIGGQEIGTVTGRPRFTLSRAIRRADGHLHAIIVVAVDSSYFASLYTEVAYWPDSRAGLFLLTGTDEAAILARMPAARRATPAFIAELNALVEQRPSGPAILKSDGYPRMVGWQRSSKYPVLFASSSQSIAAALSRWTWRTGLVLALYALTIAVFTALGAIAYQADRARRQAARHQMMLRELHHRVKNNLGIIVALINGSLRQATQPETREALTKVSAQIGSIASLYDTMQLADAAGEVDVRVLLDKVCAAVSYSTSCPVVHRPGPPAEVEPSTAVSLVVIVNELITNAIKHGARSVTLSVSREGDRVVIDVEDDGDGLPEELKLDHGKGFGLAMIRHLAEASGGSLLIVSHKPARMRVAVAARAGRTMGSAA